MALNSVLLVDDSTAVRSRLAGILAELDGVGEIREASNLSEARLQLQDFCPDTVVLDIEMPGGSGLEMLDELRAGQPGGQVIVLTNYPTPEYRNRCLTMGATYFLDKTLEFHRVAEIITGAVTEFADSPAEVREEVERLLDLFDYRIIGTPAEQCYDDLTAMAARLCAAPVALLTLHDADRQWVKSCNGIALADIPDIRRHCERTALGIAPYVVEAFDEPANEGAGTSRDGHLCFFAGAPLIAENGFSLGTLSVMDYCPRRLDDEQLGFLQALARQVVSLLEMRRTALEFRNVHVRRSMTEKALEARSATDPLTGLSNRVAFRQALGHALVRAQEQRTRVACLYIDLDDFKKVNDDLGHAAGDALLRMVAERLRDTLRDSDVVARLGGDEFAVALVGVGEVDHVALLARRLLDRLGSPYQLGSNVVWVRASIGISVSPEDGNEVDELLQRADLALAYVKERGKSEFHFFAEDLRERRNARLELESRLRRAVEHGEFTLVYQPRIACDNGALVGCEALLRWPGADGFAGNVRTLVEEAEKLGLGEALGDWVVEHACAQLSRWRQQGLAMPTLAINVTSSQMRPEFAARLRDIAAAHDVPLSCLEIEISEDYVLRDLVRAREAIDAIRGLGARVALDDFGTGYAALSVLRSVRFDAVKIDPIIVRSVGGGDLDGAMASGLIALARTLGLRITAEGVETGAQLMALRADDCDDFQGYLISPPLPPDSLAEVAQARRANVPTALLRGRDWR
ncbi:MAG: EAL domain-containing protein [Gammaproteobacteria bacterium]|nr:EAL domain-containing protein [Gammaproteobacteria bacterium]